jgi:hypothetical protein
MVKPRSLRIMVTLSCTLLSVYIILCGCSCSGEPGYKKTKVTRVGVTFSFEYPRDFTKDRDSFASDESSVLVLEHFFKQRESDEKDGKILIDYFPMVSEGKKATSYTNYYIRNLKESTPDFALAERTTVQVSGIGSEMLSYTNRFPSGLNCDTTQYWDVFFDYGGRLWNIGLASNPELYEENLKNFKHLIQTFKFLK